MTDQTTNQHTEPAAGDPGKDRAVTEPAQARPDPTELETPVAELEDLWRRALADLDNLRKRIAKQIEAARDDERARVVAQWLPVVDHLELALEHARADPGALIEGVRVVRDQAL